MTAMMVVIRLKLCEFLLQVSRIPEQCLIKKFTANRSDESLNEGMREWCIRDGLDLIDIQNPQIRLPLVIQE